MTAKEQKQMDNLYRDNMARLKRIEQLERQNEELRKEQEEFQNKLKEAISEIRAKKGIARFFAALSLLWQLIATIEEGFKE